jgi:putative ABC transport system substrate-binding protein
MRRRDFVMLAGAALAWPRPARAQHGDRLRRIGVLMALPPSDPSGAAEAAALEQGLQELGWVRGRNLAIEYRWPGGDLERARAAAQEIVALSPDVLVGRSTPAIAALKALTQSIPIVFVQVAEPVGSGFVHSLAQPGGNITGFTNFEASIGSKWLALLKELAPGTVRAGVIFNSDTAPFARSFLRSVEAAAPELGAHVVPLAVHSAAEITEAITGLAREPGGSLVAIPDAFTAEHRDLIIGLAAKLKLPAVYPSQVFAASGGLMVYAVDTHDLFQRAAGYVDRILKGAKPADLPVQQPAKFALSINLKTAKALGLTVPQTLLTSADEVIE